LLSQDEAPSHTANVVQRWCEDNFTDIIPKDEWSPSSPDLNPLDFSTWDYMLTQVRNYKYATLPEFKKGIQRMWANIHVVRAACDAFDKRLRLLMDFRGWSLDCFPAREPQVGSNVQPWTGNKDMGLGIGIRLDRHMFQFYGVQTLEFGRQLSVYLPALTFTK
jgi:hypothetical protein